MQRESDFPPGHPARFDYDAESPDAKEWARVNIHPLGERDWPVGHPKAVDTEGNRNDQPVLPGVDPDHPEREAFTGRSPEQAAALRKLYQQNAADAKETQLPTPVMAATPPTRVDAIRAGKVQGEDAYIVFCPGCKQGHMFDSRWTFNGSQQLPSFNPSMLVNGDDPQRRCHSFVTNGNIIFLDDCGHSLKGKTVELPPISELGDTIHA